MKFKVGAASDVGLKRSQNQDNLACQPELGLFVVADGMGGHRGGETASAMVAEVVPQMVRKAEKARGWNPRAVLVEALAAANQAIYRRSLETPELQGMGTTATALLFRDGRLTIGHVGDSRAYYLRPGSIWQVTRDHSLVQEKLRAGLITREEVKTDRMKNVITRSVGFEPEVNVEIYEMDVAVGDVFLVCSDGLSGMVDEAVLQKIVQSGLFKSDTIEDTVARLIRAANDGGGDDNVTLILIQVLNTDG